MKDDSLVVIFKVARSLIINKFHELYFRELAYIMINASNEGICVLKKKQHNFGLPIIKLPTSTTNSLRLTR